MTSVKRDLSSWDDLASRRPLPVQFALYRSNRVNGALCPALVVRSNGIEVIRILDPEHKQPFFSLEGIFLLAGLTVTEGLLKFQLRRDRGEFDLTLAGLEPREGVWAPWKITRDVAKTLDLLEPLHLLLSARHAWSLDERKDGITHNWRVTSNSLNWSADLLASPADQPFSSFAILPKGQQLRTFISEDQRREVLLHPRPSIIQSARDEERMRMSSFEQRLLRWTVGSLESWQDIEEDGGQRHISETSRRHSSPWSLRSVDLLVFFDQMLGLTAPLDQAGTLSLNNGQLQCTTEELNELQSSGTSSVESTETDARISVLIIHQIWRLFIQQQRHERRIQHLLDIDDEQISEQTGEHLSKADVIEQGDKGRLDSLLLSNRRLESKLDLLLSRQERLTPRDTPRHLQEKAISSRIPSSIRDSWLVWPILGIGFLTLNVVLRSLVRSFSADGTYI